MICVILASGYDRRVWPLTREIAKPLLPVGDKVVLELKADIAFLT